MASDSTSKVFLLAAIAAGGYWFFTQSSKKKEEEEKKSNGNETSKTEDKKTEEEKKEKPQTELEKQNSVIYDMRKLYKLFPVKFLDETQLGEPQPANTIRFLFNQNDSKSMEYLKTYVQVAKEQPNNSPVKFEATSCALNEIFNKSGIEKCADGRSAFISINKFNIPLYFYTRESALQEAVSKTPIQADLMDLEKNFASAIGLSINHIKFPGYNIPRAVWSNNKIVTKKSNDVLNDYENVVIFATKENCPYCVKTYYQLMELIKVGWSFYINKIAYEDSPMFLHDMGFGNPTYPQIMIFKKGNLVATSGSFPTAQDLEEYLTEYLGFGG